MIRKKIIILIIVGVAVMNLIVFGISLISLAKIKKQEIDKANITTQNLSLILEQNLTGLISKADMALQILALDAEKQLKEKKPNPSEIKEDIALILKNIPESVGARTTDPKGDAIYGVAPSKHVSVQDREYFQKCRDSKNDTMFISKPMVGRILKKWLIIMSRRINNPDSSFAGIAYITFPVDAISKMFTSIDLGKKGRIALRDGDDFAMVARIPETSNGLESMGYKKVSTEFIRLIESGKKVGNYSSRSALDQERCTWGFRKFDNGRYYIFAGIAEEEYLAGWRREVMNTEIFLGIFLLGTSLLGAYGYRSWKETQTRREQNLESEAKFKTIFEESPFLISLFDPETGRYADLSQRTCDFFGVTKEGAVGKTPEELGIACEGEFDNAFSKFKEKGHLDHQQIKCFDKNKNLTTILFFANIVHISGKAYLLGEFQNITERIAIGEENKRLTAQLLQSQKMDSIGRLAGGIAHDFNNLLTPIMGYSQMLLMEFPEGEPIHHKCSNIMLAAKKAQTLVAQLLGFSRQQELKVAQLDLNSVVSSFYSILRRTIRENIDILLCLSTTPCMTLSDRGHLDQILMNLVVNAQDAISGSGSIKIETSTAYVDSSYARLHLNLVEGDYSVLTVGDTGHGMDKETQEKIFDPFFTTKEVGKGTGLGLSTAYGLVTQLKGDIWVYSELGIGTTFKIFLPRTGGAHVQSDEVSKQGISFDGRNRTVVLLEDEHGVRELVKDFLESLNFNVVIIENADEGEALIKTAKFDLLVTDVIMPGLTGPDVYQHLSKRDPALKALFMSGYTGKIVDSGTLIGPNTEFIQKPFTVHELTAKICQILG